MIGYIWQIFLFFHLQEIVGRLQTNALKQNETIAELQSKLNGHRQTHSQSQDNHKIAELQRKNNELKSQVCDFKISLDHAKNKERAAVERAKQMEKEIRTQKEEVHRINFCEFSCSLPQALSDITRHFFWANLVSSQRLNSKGTLSRFKSDFRCRHNS